MEVVYEDEHPLHVLTLFLLKPLELYPLLVVFQMHHSLRSFAFVLPSTCKPFSPNGCMDFSQISLRCQLRGHLFSKALTVFFKISKITPYTHTYSPALLFSLLSFFSFSLPIYLLSSDTYFYYPTLLIM